MKKRCFVEPLETVQSDYELERGKHMPSKLPGRLQAKLIGLLYMQYGETHTIYSELSIALPPLYAKQVPDVALYEGATPYATTDEIVVSVPPTLAIEILSPTQNLVELTDKIAGYLTAGVKSCWLVLPGIRSVAISSQIGVYQKIDNSAKPVDASIGVELELAELFS
ncbi:MAG: Uma2 family endonuclease [Hymenobacter sp.]|nr:MAG: Uma2 family endonuclease [Hymenobacter sp.]